MSEDDARFSRLRHDLANPLAAILAETQLLLLDNTSLDDETRRALKTIEDMSMRMREILRGTSG